jgi:hypothetical protein
LPLDSFSVEFAASVVSKQVWVIGGTELSGSTVTAIKLGYDCNGYFIWNSQHGKQISAWLWVNQNRMPGIAGLRVEKPDVAPAEARYWKDYMLIFAVPSSILLVAATLIGSLRQAGYAAPRLKYTVLSSHSVQVTMAAVNSNLDSATIHKYYLDGDFEEAIAILETGLKEKRPFNHNDSVFIFKHLGVMYAAQYETREKGKFYMHQLLMTEPTAKIMDMYASDMIYMIFKNIQDEFESNRMRIADADDAANGNSQAHSNGKDPARQKNEARISSGNTALWVGATAVAAVAVGIGAYFILSDEPDSGDSDHGF